MFLYQINNIEHNIKQNIYTGMDIINGYVVVSTYPRNQRSKQANLVYIQFHSNYALFSTNWCRKLLIKTSNMKVYYLIPMSNGLAGHQENFKTKLYFQERLIL